MTHDGMEQIIASKLKEHGFTESREKPGLFYKNVSEMATIYADFRGEKDKWYGFYNKEDPLPKEIMEAHTKRVRQELSAIGMAPLHLFDQDKLEEGVLMAPASVKEMVGQQLGKDKPKVWKPPEMYCLDANCGELLVFIINLGGKGWGEGAKDTLIYQCPRCKMLRRVEHG